MMVDLEKLLNKALEKISAATDVTQVEDIRIAYLGRKGSVTLAFKDLLILEAEEKKAKGQELNEVKKKIEASLETKTRQLLEKERSDLETREWIDVTSPGAKHLSGHAHLVTKTTREMIDIFSRLGFEVVDGPEIETDWYNFEALNMPKGHPVRDTQATFFVDENLVLRTQTSPVQIRVMQNQKPPIRVIVPGKTYRRDYDVTHTPMFHQLEGLVVDKGVTLADLKGTMEVFVKLFFGEDRKIRLRPHHFAFTEPSIELDISCGICAGNGCRACKYTGWLEIAGAGMVHPNVLRNGGIDPEEYQGFAFGFGIERPAMLRSNIDDLRLFFDNDLRFLEQF
ncbi:phenylalanine--tRNA ligase subunit alpha [bacterium (Candidatus Howlettbacteria) CG_4_9_14_3_um_filter_37_10]|nr:MAG: phenylalanine--tRNA ligase subunit alpha [bacterium (Candidatus Howlettbacteria) CG23_combo_of_CG06-09_8_20_14_all_37_9]PJB06219.1 MAG: phenylalanine--tRNA ligase subunit alpha [bacterium (Candidatus Howlettbacteria) CG_4_9_14_3_um_filter_37_10]